MIAEFKYGRNFRSDSDATKSEPKKREIKIFHVDLF